MKYGLPYMGSKNKLAVRILDCLPRGGTLVDLFCGGCAVSHAAMCLGRYDHIIINDRDWRCPTLFMDALQGKFKDERRWISREDFHRLKATDPYVAFVWSFGNNLRGYMYGEDIEPFKRAIHYAIYFDDVEPARAFGLDLEWVLSIHGERQRYLAIKHYLQRGGAGVTFPMQEASGCNTANGTTACRTEQMQHVITRSVSKILGGGHFQQQSLEGKVQVMQIAALRSLIAMGGGGATVCATRKRNSYTSRRSGSMPSFPSIRRPWELQHTEADHRLTALAYSKRGGQIDALSMDYRDVYIPDTAIVYCDPPYKGTQAYDEHTAFDYDAFYDWCGQQTRPLFISEYDMPRDRFRCVAEFNHRCTFAQKDNNPVVERLFVPRHQHYVKPNEQLSLFV